MNIDLATQHQAWSFLASVFNDLPDADLIKRLRMAASSGEDAGFSSWLDGLTDEKALTLLGKDRARLIRCVDTYCIAPPYESIYVGRGENDTLSDLHGSLLDAGFAPTGECKEPADYIGMELAFLAECCARELKAVESGDAQEAQRLSRVCSVFMEKHVSTWVPLYAEKMLEAAQTGFYKDVAELLVSVFGGGEDGMGKPDYCG